MKKKKFDSISELKEFIDSEGEESDTLEYKDYRTDVDVDMHKNEIIDYITGFSNKDGGYFIIGFDKNKNLVYTNITFPLFKDKIEKWIDSFIDPRALLSMDIKSIYDNDKKCIIIYIDNKPGTCFARRKDGREKAITSYSFPYRMGGSTKRINFEEFFRIYIQKFLESLAVSSELIKKEEEKMPSIRVTGISEDDVPFNSKLVNNYIEMFGKRKLLTEDKVNLLQSIRNETLKIYHKREIKKEDLPTIENLVNFTSGLIKDKDEETVKNIIDILALLTRTTETLQIVKRKNYEYLQELFESGARYKDLLGILDACGYFHERVNWIINAIENKDEDLLKHLISGFDLSTLKENNFEIIEKLLLLKKRLVEKKILDLEKNKTIIDRIDNIIRQLEMV